MGITKIPQSQIRKPIVSMTQGRYVDGTSNSGFANAGNQFSTIQFAGPPQINIGGGIWNTTNNTYQVPTTGRYLITSKLRIKDGSTARSFGVGVGVSNIDAPYFSWRQFGGVARDTFLYTRIDSFIAGDLLRLYIYSDNAGVDTNGAEITIDLI